ncbi:MAG: metal ABC transporter permease [Chloroflexi bacterium]|nr:MAG: metal ABC transporter permease [Chloroflexota bacterium]RLC86060.1 MAG: metal ABC transporter permease [Chloroflexota bacterium]
MLELLSYTFMQRALIAGALIGALCAVIGVYVVLKGLSFIGAGIAHASFGGVALGFLLGVNPVLTAVVFCLLTAWGIGLVSRKGQIKEDTAVGIFFASTMALGILLIGLMRGYNVDLFGYLFGSILAVTPQDVWVTIGLGAAVLGVVGLLFKELLFITFDPEMAEVTGVPAGKLYFLLLSLIAVTVVVSIKVVGIILVSALIVTPAAAAYQLTEDFRRMMALSVVFGVGSTVGGLLLSYWLNTASGATIVLLATLVFFVAAMCSPRRRRRPALQRV